MSAGSLTNENQHRSDGITSWHAQMRQPVQDRTAHQHLRRLSVEATRGDSLAKDHLQAEHRCFCQRAPVIMALALPLGAAMTADLTHVLVAGVSLLLAIAVLPDACALLGRDHGPR